MERNNISSNLLTAGLPSISRSSSSFLSLATDVVVSNARLTLFNVDPERNGVSTINYGRNACTTYGSVYSRLNFSFSLSYFSFFLLLSVLTRWEYCLFLYRIRHKRKGCPITLSLSPSLCYTFFNRFVFLYYTNPSVFYSSALTNKQHASRYQHGVKHLSNTEISPSACLVVSSCRCSPAKRTSSKLTPTRANRGYRCRRMPVCTATARPHPLPTLPSSQRANLP